MQITKTTDEQTRKPQTHDAMFIYGIEYATENETRDIEIQDSLEDAISNLQDHYDFIYDALKNGLIYPDYATQCLPRLTWKSKDSEEWF